MTSTNSVSPDERHKSLMRRDRASSPRERTGTKINISDKNKVKINKKSWIFTSENHFYGRQLARKLPNAKK